jgi:putative ABC transport system permease protein
LSDARSSATACCSLDEPGKPSSAEAGATRLQDAYFTGGTARQLISQLVRQPDAVLVSAETVRDFQLSPGDQLRLRLQDGPTSRLVLVPFHYAGIVKEFPTAPRDSFFVANASYVAVRTGNPSIGEFLINTDGTTAPPAPSSPPPPAGSSRRC